MEIIIPKRHILIDPASYPSEFLSGCVLRMPLWGYSHRMVGSRFADYSVYGNHGTPYGGYWEKQGQTRVRGKDGIDDYDDCGNDASLDITDEIEVGAWVKPLALQTLSPIGKMYAYRFWVSENAWYFGVYDDAENSYGSGYSITAISPETWGYVAGIYNPGLTSGNVQIWINNVKENTGDHTGSIAVNTNTFKIGGNISTWEDIWFYGFIAETCIYSRARSDEERRTQFLYDIQHLPFIAQATYLRKYA